jgi:hypothetical protein
VKFSEIYNLGQDPFLLLFLAIIDLRWYLANIQTQIKFIQALLQTKHEDNTLVYKN